MPKSKYDPQNITTIYEQNVPRSFQEATRKKLTRRSLSLITNINNAMRDRIREVLRDGVREGKSVSAVASSLLTTGLDKGVYHSARKRAWMVAKTELHRARQRGAIDIYKHNKIKQVQWVVISDGRICDRCRGRGGQIYRVKDLNEENMPPIHPSCRCRLLPTDFQVSIKVKQTDAGKVMETKISPTPQNYKYVIKLKKSLDLEKGKRVQVKPYQRKGKYVLGYSKFDPRDKKVLYHGTYEKFDRFLPPDEVPEEVYNPAQHAIGVYVTESEEFARTFGDKVVKVAKPEKTLDLTNAKTFDDFVALLPIDKEANTFALKRMKIDSMWGDEEIDMQYKLIEDLDNKFGIVEKLKEQGYDSLSFKEEHNNKKANTVVIFDAKKAKIVKSLDVEDTKRKINDYFANVTDEQLRKDLIKAGLEVDEKELSREVKKVDTSPTEAEKESGTYQKGHIDIGGLEVSIENPKGSYRSGVSKDGKEWKTQLHSHYGYIKGTKGKDKDHLDVFIGDDLDSDKVFVVNQTDPKTKEFDEHKILLGFSNEEKAKEGYLANYEKDWQGIGSIVEKPFDEFKDWATSGHTTTKLDKALERIDYLLKAVQVKGFTRTRKGKMERVKPFSREQVLKEVERLRAKEPIEVGGKFFKQSDSSKKWNEEVVLVDVSKFDADWSKDDDYYVSPSGKGAIGGRIENFKEFLETGKPIEMAEVSARPEGLTSRVGFTNGRHRFAVLRDMGFKVIPVSVDKKSAKVMKDLFGSKIETAPDTQEPELFEEALGSAVRQENRARHKVEDTKADSYPITEEKKETLRALRVASDHTDSLIEKKFNLALFKAEFDQHGLTDRTEDLKYVIHNIRNINEKMNFDGKGILKVICTDIVSSEKGVLAEYFNDDVSIKINKKYENTLGHEYAHFLFSKSIMEGTTYPIADFNSVLPSDPNAIIAIDGDAVELFLEKVGKEFSLKQTSKEPFLELLNSLKELYSKKVPDATFTPKSLKYFLDVNEMFARAVEAYIDGEPGIVSSDKFRVIEGNDEYYQLAKTWGDKYLKTGIVKSLEKAIQELEKSKQVQVKPYQRKGKYVLGYHRYDPREKIGEPFTVERMLSTQEAIKVGEKLSREEVLELWEEYKQITDSPYPEDMEEFKERAFRVQTLREIVEGYIGVEGDTALRPYEIDEILGIGYPFSTGVSPEQRIERQLDPARSDVKLALDVINDVTEAGGRAMIVGGFVRDALLGKPSKDLDIEVYSLSPDKLKSILDKRGEVAQVGKSFGVFIFKSPELSEAIDVSLPRRESKTGKGHKGFMVEPDSTMTPKEAAKRRDLTINSMGYDPNKKEFIDPYNGQQDLKDKILRAVDKETFGDDPLRVLRVMRFAGNLGFTIDPELVDICNRLSDSLEELPKERIYGEMEKLLLKSKKPSLGIQTIPLLGIKLFPELTDMIGVGQDPGWHPEGDVWTHTLKAIDDAAKKKEQFSDNKDKLIYMLATLLHDVGKPNTPGFNEKGRITHRKHSEVGAKIATEFLKRRLTDEDVILSKVENLIRYHMTPTEYYKAKINDSAIRKLAKKLDIPMLVAVSSADKQGRGPSLRNKLNAERWLMKRYHALGLDKPEALKPIVMGRHLLEIGIQPGIAMGKILNEIYEAQLSGRFDTVESGIDFARKVGLLEPLQKGFYIGGDIAKKQLLELKKGKNDGKLIPMRDGNKIRWFKSFGEDGLWRKVKGAPSDLLQKGSTILVKGKLSNITAVGKDGVTAIERASGNKYKVLYKNVELMKSI